MDTRVTPQTVLQNTLAATRRLTDQLDTLQAQVSTGKRFTNVSDDPTTVLTLLAGDSQSAQLNAQLQNVTLAQSNLQSGVSSLQQISDVLSQARSLALEGSNSSNDANANIVLAQQVDALLNRLVDLANTQNNDSYVFAGTAVKTAPFAVTARDGQGSITQVRYQGSSDATRTVVDTHQNLAIYYPGSDLLASQQRQATTFTGTTGAKPGGGTDSATGRAQLTIRHDATTFAAGAGVQAGASSAAGDTILGPAGSHRLHITDTSGDGSAGTISLDGGLPVAFTNASTDLRLTSANGDVVYLNTTAITPNFDGDIDITANGSMSIDGGASFTPLAFAANQTVSDSTTGKTTFVDTTQVRRAGNEDVDYPGTSDAFQTLIALRDSLRNTRNLPASDQLAAISNSAADLDRVRNHVLQAVGAQSASLQSLDALQSHFQDVQVAIQKSQSDLGDVDLADMVVKLQSYQSMLTLSLQTFSRIVDQNLLDFLK